MSLESKLSKLEEKTRAKGLYAVSAAATDLLADVQDIDRQINLTGALHETGHLKNSLAPYWKEFRANEPLWIGRCLSRLLAADHDYWALAGLLGCNGPSVIEIAAGMGFKSLARWFYERYDAPDIHVNTLYLNAIGNVLHPIFEIGCDSKDLTVTDTGRARALTLDNEDWGPGKVAGNGWLAMSMQAKLPHGAWRSVSVRFEVGEDQRLP